MSDSIVVTISFDEGYAEQATVMLYSLFENNHLSSFQVYAFTHNVKEETKKRIEKNLCAFTQCVISWVRIDPSLLNHFIIRKGHVNENTYSRIFMAELLPQVNRFLYLDCDMLVLENISPLWSVNLAGKVLAAVEDPTPFHRHSDLGIPPEKKYFNAGVLLVDAQTWRWKNYTEAVVNKLIALGGKAGFWDQDGLNATLYNDWLPVEKKWNIQSHDIMLAQQEKIKDIKLHLSPTILHFTGSLKPWNFKSTSPMKKEYYQYLKKTDFYKTHKPENKTTVNVIRRAARNIFIYLHLVKP